MSEQQLIDCSVAWGNNGCSGGLVEYAYRYAEENPLESEQDYPYKATNQKCQYVEGRGNVKVVSFHEVERFSPSQLA